MARPADMIRRNELAAKAVIILVDGLLLIQMGR